MYRNGELSAWRWRLGRDERGKPVRFDKRRRVGQSVQDFMADVRKKQAEIATGNIVQSWDGRPLSDLVGWYVAELLPVRVASKKVGRAEAASLRSALKLHVLEYFIARKKLGGLRAYDFEQHYQTLIKAGQSASTVQRTHKALRQVIEQAVKNDWLPVNHVKRAETPKAETAERPHIKPADLGKFAKAVSESWYANLYLLGIELGARPQDLQRIKDSDIKFFDDETGEGLIQLRGTKTKAAARWDSLTGEGVAIVKAQQAQKRKARLLTPTLFCTPTGAPIGKKAKDEINKELPALCEAANLPVIKLHGLRHTGIVRMEAAGVDPYVMRQRVGHAQRVTTYEHRDIEAQRRELRKVPALNG